MQPMIKKESLNCVYEMRVWIDNH